MPNQAGSSPARSRRSSSSRTGDTSCRDRTGEHWVSPAEGFEEDKAEPGAEQPPAAQARTPPSGSQSASPARLGLHHIYEAGGRTSLGRRGTSGPFVGWGWGLQGREALPSFPSDCNRT